MKTLSDLKRDAKSGKLFAEMVIRCGGTDIPDTLKGKRQIVDANTVGITFLNNNGKKSELRIEAASLVDYLVDYDDSILIVYNPGLRDLTEDEKTFFEKWEQEKLKTDYARRSDIDALSDGSSTYWQKKFFFKDAGFEYLLGYEKKQGKKFDYNTNKVWDNSIKGDICMKYIIHKI